MVTGVAGFIGSHLAERLIADGHQVLGVDAMTDFYPRVLKEDNLRSLRRSADFHFIEADLNALDLSPLLAECEWIFHQAAQAGVRTSWGESFALYSANNITATQRLLEAAVHAPRLRRLVYASSSSVYGDAVALPTTESASASPFSPYGVTKLAGEHLCMLYWKNYQVPAVALRYFSVYGPRQRPDMAFHRFGEAILTGKPLRIFGDGGQTRDYTYVGDVVEANLCAAEETSAVGQVLNIAGGSHVSLRETLALLEELTGRAADVRYEDNAPGDTRDTYGDATRAREALGFRANVALREGLALEVDYLQELYAAVGSAKIAS